MHIRRGFLDDDPDADFDDTDFDAPTPTGNLLLPTTAAAPIPEITPAAIDYSHSLVGVNQSLNIALQDVLWWILGVIGLVILAIRIMEILWAKLRQVSAMSAPRAKQNYWKISQWSWMPAAKRLLIYAPLWKKRHNREFRVSSTVNMGTLPTRLHFIIIGIYIVSNIVYTFMLTWGAKDKMAFHADLRGRSGVLAVVNMLPLFIMAGRNNPLIALLKISFDTYNLMHRWLGRLVIVEALVHTFAWWRVVMHNGGLAKVWLTLNGDAFYISGLVGTVASALILILSINPLRHAFLRNISQSSHPVGPCYCDWHISAHCPA